jgi:hypothetical protein
LFVVSVLDFVVLKITIPSVSLLLFFETKGQATTHVVARALKHLSKCFTILWLKHCLDPQG